ncbi:MAG: AraC family transcriptional regulator [Gammaproteobacteria bacterium]|nr:AraC family transcriptional regulator [Gammaproteobacteria bacterium]
MKDIKYYTTSLVPNNLLRQAESSGIQVDRLAKKYGISEKDLADPFGWVEVDPVMNMIEEIAQISKIRNIGFYLGSQSFHPSHWSIGGYAMDTAADMDHLFELIIGLTNGNEGDSHLVAGFVEEQSTISYFLRPVSSQWGSMNNYVEYWMAQTFHVIQSYIGKSVQATELCFAHAQQGELSAYEKFFGCSVCFEQPMNLMRLPSEWKAIIGPKRDDQLHATLLKLVSFYVRAHHFERPFTDDVRYTLERLLYRKTLPTLESVAKIMCVSSRNLQRRLNSEDSSFSEIWDEVRQYHATLTLRNGDTPIAEIAEILGYKGVSAFYSAFKRWTGYTPKDYRDKYSKNFTGYLHNDLPTIARK